MSYVGARLGHSQRRICRALDISGSAVRYEPQPRVDESDLTGSILRLASRYGRYGYRRIHALLQRQGWQASHGRVMRIWRREGLKVPHQQPKRSRLWLIRRFLYAFASRANHVLSWDFVFDRTDDGRPFKLMVVIDEYTRQCLAIHVARRWWRRNSEFGWPDSARRPSTLRLVVPGRMATVNYATPNSETSC